MRAEKGRVTVWETASGRFLFSSPAFSFHLLLSIYFHSFPHRFLCRQIRGGDLLSQKGFSLLEFLVVVLILVLFLAIATPLLTRPDHASAESKAIAAKRQIYTAEQDHFGATRLYGPMSKLVLPNRGPDQGFTAEGYAYYLTVGGAFRRWCAAAVPEKAGEGRHFGIDETGTILAARSPIDCSDGSLDRSRGDIVK